MDIDWCRYRFLELYYHRGEYKNTEKNSSVSSRVETVVIFLPDVHSCLPSAEQWTQLTQTYKKAGENAVMRPPVSTSSVSGSGKSKSSNTDPEEAAITTPLKGGNKQQDAVSLTPTAETPTKGKDNDGLSKSSPSLSSSNTSQVADSLDESKDNNTGGHSANAEEKVKDYTWWRFTMFAYTTTSNYVYVDSNVWTRITLFNVCFISLFFSICCVCSEHIILYLSKMKIAPIGEKREG